MSNRTMTANARNNKPQFDDEHENDDHGHGDDHGRAARVISDPHAVVDGRTISEWSQKWADFIYNSPAGTPQADRDPTGVIADRLNSEGSSMYFITLTGAQFIPGPPQITAPRTFEVESGQNVFVSLGNRLDSENSGNPGISPSLPGFPATPEGDRAQVLAVLARGNFSSTLSLDGQPYTNVMQTETGIFDLGTAMAGDITTTSDFGASVGASLATTGLKGVFAVFEGLSEGRHEIVATTNLTFASSGAVATIKYDFFINVD